VIVERIANMLRHGIAAKHILAVTFTNKAAKEMRERVLARTGGREEDIPLVCTFHSFCTRVLRQYADYIGFSRHFTLAGEGYQTGLLREIAVELGLANDNVDPYGWLSKISLAKSAMLSPDQMADTDDELQLKVSRIYRRYQQRLKQMDMMDFDDLLANVVLLWNTRPDLLEAYRERFQYLMIDEYQDTNAIQLHIMVQLAGKRANICAVGDDDQSIYAWRGADSRNILDFETFFPNAKIIRLEQNYRSTNTILKAANGVISHNTKRREKNLWSNQGEGEILHGIRCANEQAEAKFIADSIYSQTVSSKDFLSRNRDWTRFAVLIRTGGQALIVDQAFRQRRIPYILVGSKSFYQNKEILDLLSMMELAVNPKSDMNLTRVINVPPRGVGDATLSKLSSMRDITHLPMLEILARSQFLNDLPPETARQVTHFRQAILRCGANAEKPGAILPRVKSLIDDIDYINKLIQMYRPRENALQRKDNVLEFLNAIAEYDEQKLNGGTLQDYLERIALQDANDRREKDKDVTDNAVNILTIHASKGLEFPIVYVAGMENELFPHKMALTEGNLEEERRLCYVALTRAKTKLFLTYAEKRKVLTSVIVRRISPFLNEIPPELIQFCTPEEFFQQKTTTTEEELSFLSQIMNSLK
ncbi:MAG: UvrD-helicase domain-containing protein, partial [Victivallales bacterium]|nr:UvrD-helicase domain-containing protein [Victivallales bacterium]